MNTLQQNPTFEGSRKIPRYIYHMTNRANYESIMKDGFIRMGDSNLHVDNGVYAFDLCNFFKRWKVNKDWGYDDLQRIILRHIVKWFENSKSGQGDLVILRLQTANLDIDKLAVRSMNRLFKFEDSEQKISDISYSLLTHLTGGTSAKETPKYTMRKEAIEFIYKDNIPIENVQRIGNIVNISSLRKDIRFGINPVRYIMQALLEGTPEAKGADLLH